jgi:hypothetical protein
LKGWFAVSHNAGYAEGKIVSEVDGKGKHEELQREGRGHVVVGV